MTKLYLIYKTDAHHSYASRDLIGVSVEVDPISIVLAQVEKEGEKLDEEQLFNLRNIEQTQGYSGEGEFHFEEVSTDVLL